MHDDGRAEPRFVDVFQEHLGLLFHPGFVGMEGRRRDENATRIDVYEHKQEEVAESLDRQHLLRIEVALPERGRVNLQELVPRAGPALRSRLKPVLLQDVLDRVPRRRLYAQLLELAQIRV